MGLRIKTNSGFTFVELMATTVVGSAMVLVFGVVMLMIQGESTVSNDMVKLNRNVNIVDNYMIERMNRCYGDSMKVYYNDLTEWLGWESNVGHIIHLNDRNGNDYRITRTNQAMEWSMNDEPQYPLDVDVQDLFFVKTSTPRTNKIKVLMNLKSGRENYEYDRTIYIRN